MLTHMNIYIYRERERKREGEREGEREREKNFEPNHIDLTSEHVNIISAVLFFFIFSSKDKVTWLILLK